MDIQNIDPLINRIKVRNIVNADVEVVNNSPLLMMGKGRQGAVFQVNDAICVKVFGNTEDCDREYYALSLGQKTDLFPKLYGKGPLYIAMEIINGVDVREYLQSQPLTKTLSAKLIEMLLTFKRIGFERIDHHKRQIFIQSDGNLKVIDVARTVWRDRVYPYPRKLLNSLGEENKALFLAHVQEMSPELYEEWRHYMRMEEIAKEITKLLLPQTKEIDIVKALSDSLLTTKDEKNYVVLLEGLVHKVFKEEWVKTMIARGVDPEKVMEKIDEYWNNRENSTFEREEPRFVGERRYEGVIDTRWDRKSRYHEGEKSNSRHRHHDRGRRFEGERSHRHDRHHDRRRRFAGER